MINIYSQFIFCLFLLKVVKLVKLVHLAFITIATYGKNKKAYKDLIGIFHECNCLINI